MNVVGLRALPEFVDISSGVPKDTPMKDSFYLHSKESYALELVIVPRLLLESKSGRQRCPVLLQDLWAAGVAKVEMKIHLDGLHPNVLERSVKFQ